MNLVEKLRGIRDLTILECGHDVNDWAEYDHECVGRAEEAADRIEELEKGYRILIKQWETCSNMGYCPDLGYPIEDWCVHCIAQAALNKGKDQ